MIEIKVQLVLLLALFAAQTQLRYIEERAPLIPARAPLALLRAWIQAFRADLAPV